MFLKVIILLKYINWMNKKNFNIEVIRKIVLNKNKLNMYNIFKVIFILIKLFVVDIVIFLFIYL